MLETEQVIQAYILVIILTIASIFTSTHLYLCILSVGLLLIVFTMRSLTEEPDGILFAVQICLSVAFVIFFDGVWPCLIFYECRLMKRQWLQIFLPALALCIIQATGRQPLPLIIVFGLILTGISGLIFLMESLVIGYLSARQKSDIAVSISAVNETYEKKLNRELVVKNFLTDKNARLEERETISRNIHNSVGHSITAAIMTLDAADLLFEKDPAQAREKLNAANRRIRTSLNTIRHAVRVLDEDNKYISVSDFLQEINDLVDSFVMDTTIQINLDSSDLPAELQIPREHTEFLTGAVQELMSNGVRHGGADRFRLRLTGDSGHIRLMVQDNGCSDFSEENQAERINRGFGLKKLISYTQRCGGYIDISNANSFRTEITLPLEGPTAEYK